MEPLSKAIEVIGSQQKLAERCGVVQAAVSAWLKRGSVPSEHCAVIERATNGTVTRKDLRPNDWQRIWPELVDRSCDVDQASYDEIYGPGMTQAAEGAPSAETQESDI